MVVITELATVPYQGATNQRQVMVAVPQQGVVMNGRRRRRRAKGQYRNPQAAMNVMMALPSNNGRGRRRRRRRNRRQARVMPANNGIVDPRASMPAQRAMTALKYRTSERSANEGAFSAVGPMTEVADTWSDKAKVGAADGLVKMSLATTLPGKMAAAKALHPACNVGPQRWPDQAANETCVLQNTDVFTVNRNTTTGEEPWNLVCWITSFMDMPIITSSVVGSYANPMNDMNSGNTGTGQQPGKAYACHYSTQWANDDKSKHPGNDFQKGRITARSGTFDLVANATTNQGVVYACQFTPDQMLMPEVGGPSLTSLISKVAEQKMVEVLRRARLMEDEHSSDDGEADSDELLELLTTKFDRMAFGPKKWASPSDDDTGYRYVFQNWPWNPQLVMQVSTSSYMAKACEGAYLPLKHASDTLQYYPCAAECYLSATVPHTTDSETSEMNVLPTGDWCQGVVIFAGLNPQAVVSIKMITALELAPRSDSQLAKFTEEAPPLDKMAQTHTRAAMGNMPDAFPARDNVLGGVVEWIAGALAMSGIPIVSQIAGAASTINRMTGGVATKWLDSEFF